MIAGQIASRDVVGVCYADEVTTVWGLRQRLCSMAAPDNKSRKIYPDACRKCMHCGYGKQLLKLIEEGRIKV